MQTNAFDKRLRYKGRLSSEHLIGLVHKRTGHYVYWDPKTPWNRDVYERWTPEHGTVLNGICSKWLERRMNGEPIVEATLPVDAPRSPVDANGLSGKGNVPAPIVNAGPRPPVELFVVNPNGTVHRPECYMAATGAEPVSRGTAILTGKRTCKRCIKDECIVKIIGDGDA